jgi:protein involved in polysaccharide export with SLBB domain
VECVHTTDLWSSTIQACCGFFRHSIAQSKTAVYLSSLLYVLCASGCSQQPQARLADVSDTGSGATLGPGDIVEVRVYDEKEMSGEYQVSPDGTINFPFLGVMMVGGHDTKDVARAIESELAGQQILRQPYVAVMLKESNSKLISVLGAVAKPGTFQLIPGMTAVQAISQAGGFTPLASKDDTVVSRRTSTPGGKVERFRIAMTSISRGDADDFTLRPGDIIFVPERVF